MWRGKDVERESERRLDATGLGGGGGGSACIYRRQRRGRPRRLAATRARFLFLGEVAAGGEEEEEGRSPEKEKKKAPGQGRNGQKRGRGPRAGAGPGAGGGGPWGPRVHSARKGGKGSGIGPGPRTSAWEGSGLRPFGPAACCVRRAGVTVGQQRVPVWTVGPRGVENSRLVTRFALLPRHWRTGWGLVPGGWCKWCGTVGGVGPARRWRGHAAWARGAGALAVFSYVPYSRRCLYSSLDVHLLPPLTRWISSAPTRQR